MISNTLSSPQVKQQRHGAFEMIVNIQGVIDPALQDHASRIEYLYSHLKHELSGLDYGFFHHDLDRVSNTFQKREVLSIYDQLDSNSLHVARRLGVVVSNFPKKLMTLANSHFEQGRLHSLVLHLDLVDYFEEIETLSHPELPLRFENLGSMAESGKTFDEVQKALETFSRWDLVLDVAHALEMERDGDASLLEFVLGFSERVSQIQFSYPGNFYDLERMGEGFKTTHSLLTLDPRLGKVITDMIPKLPSRSVVLEGVIPPGDRGIDLLRKEMSLFDGGDV